jgi:predicted transposase YdaD
LAKSEREVRNHVVQWVTNIRQTPNLDPQTEEKLVAILSQLIEQKFRSLSYKELAAMLRLTPLRETASVQEVLKEDRVDMLTAQIQDKFKLSDKLVTTVRTDLEKLNADMLYLLIRQILHLDTLEALEQWIAEQSPMIQHR